MNSNISKFKLPVLVALALLQTTTMLSGQSSAPPQVFVSVEVKTQSYRKLANDADITGLHPFDKLAFRRTDEKQLVTHRLDWNDNLTVAVQQLEDSQREAWETGAETTTLTRDSIFVTDANDQVMVREANGPSYRVFHALLARSMKNHGPMIAGFPTFSSQSIDALTQQGYIHSVAGDLHTFSRDGDVLLLDWTRKTLDHQYQSEGFPSRTTIFYGDVNGTYLPRIVREVTKETLRNGICSDFVRVQQFSNYTTVDNRNVPRSLGISRPTVVKVFPTEVANGINIEIPEIDSPNNAALITVTDVVGKVVHRSEAKSANSWLDLQSLTPGIYLVNVHVGGHNFNSKVFKR